MSVFRDTAVHGHERRQAWGMLQRFVLPKHYRSAAHGERLVSLTSDRQLIHQTKTPSNLCITFPSLCTSCGSLPALGTEACRKNLVRRDQRGAGQHRCTWATLDQAGESPVLPRRSSCTGGSSWLGHPHALRRSASGVRAIGRDCLKVLDVPEER